MRAVWQEPGQIDLDEVPDWRTQLDDGDAHRRFDQHQPGWVDVGLRPAAR
jgi:hypothetical protein